MKFSRPFHRFRAIGAVNPFAVAILIVSLISTGLFFAFTLPGLNARKNSDAGKANAALSPSEGKSPANPVPSPGSPTSPGQTSGQPSGPVSGTGNTVPPATPAAPLAEPSTAMENLAKALLAGRPDAFLDAMGPEIITPRVMLKLESLLGQDAYQIDPGQPLGELGRQADLQRWAIHLRHRNIPGNKATIELDFTRQADGIWKPSALRLPGDGAGPAGELIADTTAIDTALAFIKAVMSQDFASARKHVDGSKVNDATIAGLCILFEEAAFTLKKDRPLVATVAKDDVAWFLAQVEGKEPGSDSRFGIVLQREPGKSWLITEVNLDRLLAAYASRFSEGDVYFTPIVRNPQGGDSIVLYFAYDSGELHPRTRRQIEIVARVLKADTARKLKISGHTDALGRDDYNDQLSHSRAEAVRKTLEEFGVPATQITVEGFGASRPRRENFNPDGTDNPEGRRVNRRAEIYLDF